MKDLANRVKKLMEDYPAYRDNKNKLLAHIWFHESADINDVREFLVKMSEGKLSSFSSIDRAYRKILEECPHLRGPNYLKRKEKGKNYKNKELKEIEEAVR